MLEIVETLVKQLVDKPENVKVSEIKSERTSIFELKIAPEEIGKVIGKEGRIIRALRLLMSAIGAKNGKRVVIEILE